MEYLPLLTYFVGGIRELDYQPLPHVRFTVLPCLGCDLCCRHADHVDLCGLPDFIDGA